MVDFATTARPTEYRLPSLVPSENPRFFQPRNLLSQTESTSQQREDEFRPRWWPGDVNEDE